MLVLSLPRRRVVRGADQDNNNNNNNVAAAPPSPPPLSPLSPLFASPWRGDVRQQYGVRLLPVVLWLGSYVLARYVPALVPLLALRFPLSMNDDGSDATTAVGGADADMQRTAAAAAAASSSPSSSSAQRVALPLSPPLLLRACMQLVHALLSLVRGPIEACRRRLLLPLLLRLSSRQQQQHHDNNGSSSSGHRGVCASLLTCVTSLLVHGDYSALVDTAFTYLTIDVLDKRAHAASDLLASLAASTVTNVYLCTTLCCLDDDGAFVSSSSSSSLLSSTAAQQRRRGLHHLPALYRLAPIAYFLVSLLSATNQFPVSVLSQTRLSSVELRDSSSSSSSTATALSSRHDYVGDGNASGRRVRLRVPSRRDTTATATTATPYDTPPSSSSLSPSQLQQQQRQQHTHCPSMFAYVCSGKGFTYALAGYRFARYGDVGQCSGALWSYAIDVVELVMHRVVDDHVYTTLPMLPATWSRSSNNSNDNGSGSGSGSGSGGRTAATAATRETAYVLRCNSSADVVRAYLLYFASGVGMALAVRHAPSLWRRLRPHVPLLSAVVDWLWPPPLPPLSIPDEVVEKASAQQGVLRVCVTRAPPRGSTDGNTNNINDGSSSLEQGVGEEWVSIPVPADCFCPITYTIMRDPVSTVDGFTYEREAIDEWLRVHNTAPMTNLPLRSATLTSNVAVRARIAAVVRAYEAARSGTPVADTNDDKANDSGNRSAAV